MGVGRGGQDRGLRGWFWRRRCVRGYRARSLRLEESRRNLCSPYVQTNVNFDFSTSTCEQDDLRHRSIVKWLKERLYHPVQLICPDLLICSVFFELHPWLLPPCSGL